MRRRLVAARLAFMSLLLAPVAAVARDLPEIRKDGTLRVLVVPVEREPEFVDLGSKTRPGFDLEILNGFARSQKLEFQVVSVGGWDLLVPALARQHGDLIAGRFSDTEARRKHVAFTQPVFPTGVVVVTRKPHRIVKTVDELRTERVGTIRGTSMDEAL